MIAAALLAFSLFGGGQMKTAHRHVGGWVVDATTDRFTKTVTCTIGKGWVSFANDVLIFHLGRRADTDDADFRIDGGPARSVREATYEDQRRGYYRSGGSLENPSAGEVALPSFYVAGAKRVYIRAAPGRTIESFDVRRFADALTLARQMNCPGVGP